MLAASAATDAESAARKASGWPNRCELAHAFLWEHSEKRLQLAQLRSDYKATQIAPFVRAASAATDAASVTSHGSTREPAAPPATAAATYIGNLG